MIEKLETKGTFTFDQDSKRYHRFNIVAESGVIGKLYIPKDAEIIPQNVILEYRNQE